MTQAAQRVIQYDLPQCTACFFGGYCASCRRAQPRVVTHEMAAAQAEAASPFGDRELGNEALMACVIWAHRHDLQVCV